MARAKRAANDIAFAKIFPPIGIARVGDSDDEFFYGPEFQPLEVERSEDFRYRDAQGHIKRQAARFRVYGFDANGQVVREITADQATITWTVHLANKKAAWFAFTGTAPARLQFAGSTEAESHPLRNPTVGKIVRDQATNRFVSDARRRALEIDGGAKRIEGVDQRPEADERGDRYRFIGHFNRSSGHHAGHEVYLGELQTDEKGRLIVLGGHGLSQPVGPDGPVTGDARLAYWIVNYANNNNWHDDVSDGPVTAKVVLKDKNHTEITVDGGAWIVVAPPDFAPDVANIVTMYDVMEEVAIAARMKPGAGCPALRDLSSVNFTQDIAPVLQRMNNYRWVSPLGLRGHGYGKPGEAVNDVLMPATADSDIAMKARERFFNVIRKPNYPALDPSTGQPAEVDDALAAAQATSFFMPPLSGDEGDRTPGAPSTWLTVTRLIYGRMERWKNGDFERDDRPAHDAKPGLQEEPAQLTRSALAACAGGPFFPGIEMTAIVREPSLYSEPFRIDHGRVGPGDVSKYMACPWQADFYECRDTWWPAQRPDTVITDLTFQELFANFESEKSSGFEAVMFRRERWDRGLERKPRPALTALVNELFPTPPTPNAHDYATSIASRAASRLIGLSPLATYIGMEEPLQPGTEAERLPSPWRLQYLTQEQLDGYSGRYFLPTIPSPEAAVTPAGLAEALGGISGYATFADVRRNWTTLRITHPEAAGRIVALYATAANTTLRDYIVDVILSMPAPDGAGGATPASVVQAKLINAPPPNPMSEPQEFTEDSDAFRRLRGSEFVDQIISRLFLRRASQAPDMAMVDEWRHLGFVRRKTIAADETTGTPEITIQIETERNKYDGKSFRDYFYYLMNIEEFPDFLPYARTLALRFLDGAQRLIDDTAIFDPNHPESFVPYTPENFGAKLEQIYEILRSQADTLQQYVYMNTRNERIERLLANAPFNQTDGAWLRYAANAGTMNTVTGLLFDVWSDEVGNGDPSLHHGNLYTSLLKSLGVYLPEVTSRDYADEPRIDEASYIGPVFQLAISQHSQEFFPELIGMTLFLEWEVLSLVPGIKRSDYFGIDSQFWRMHVGIDNATEGHGAKAKQATMLYLDEVFRESGPDAMQDQWKRIWRGFVAFASAGYDLFSNLDGISIEDEQARHTRTPADRVVDIMTRKLPYGNLNHLRSRLGLYRINDLFDDPDLFLDELANSPWVVPGDPESSRFLTLLTTFQGPMYRVFSAEDLATWREWIIWLGREGDTLRPKRHIMRSEAMMIVLAEMRQLMTATHGHRLYRVPTKVDTAGNPIALAELFKSNDLKEVMRVLANPRNGWVIPYRPAESVLIVDLMRPARDMGTALDRRVPQLFNVVARMVVYEWIAAGCPLPDEPIPDPSQTIVPKRPATRLFVQQVGMGAVH